METIIPGEPISPPALEKLGELRQTDASLIRDRVLDAIRELDEPVAPKDIALLVGITRLQANNALYNLRTSGKVTAVSRGMYRVSNGKNRPAPIMLTPKTDEEIYKTSCAKPAEEPLEQVAPGVWGRDGLIEKIEPEPTFTEEEVEERVRDALNSQIRTLAVTRASSGLDFLIDELEETLLVYERGGMVGMMMAPEALPGIKVVLRRAREVRRLAQ